ncbi:uncharacterized protein LOC128855805 [Anastrepha ludens]|uniref:uncharacterized protein LOC128855805 n=1 Tax=Anastrepha ludens TaxID=28586 RepID=UPI0023B0E535|nr:uncharacterized protein LOC128855805 [Anastrepha ludens]
MASFEQFVVKVKPALDMFLRVPIKAHLDCLRSEILQFNFRQMKVFHVQILAPLVLKLEEVNGQDMVTGILDCIRIVMSKLYLDDVQELRTLLVIVLKQIREPGAVATRPNLSEELKLVSVQCIAEALRRSSSDVLELFYTKESAMLLGQILLSLVEFVEKTTYRKLIIASLECLMTVFYVHDEAEFTDVVLRNQVADIIFIFLPKIITVLLKTSLADEKLGETLKSTAIKALGRVLCVIFEQSNEAVLKCSYDKDDFKHLIHKVLQKQTEPHEFDVDMVGSKIPKSHIEDRLKLMQSNGRSEQWFKATSLKLRIVYAQTSILRSHESVRVRTEYARMCCSLIERCAHNLAENFLILLENIVAMSEDEDKCINRLCRQTLSQLQQQGGANESIFDEYAEILFDEHLAKLPRIINRCADVEQYAELIFLKGFFNNLSVSRINCLLLVPKNLEMLCRCLLSAVDMKISSDLLIEEYATREVVVADYTECAKLKWRQYKYLSSDRCVKIVQEICAILGNTKSVNRLVYDFLLELLAQNHQAMNEILLLSLWVGTGIKKSHENHLQLVEMLIEEILNDQHWYLALKPDASWRLKVDKPTDWFVDRTPGLYESAVEIRIQDLDSDDETDFDEGTKSQRVTILDAQFNVLHTCLALDVLGHCALFYGDRFDRYIFRCLHKVLLKVASSNTMVYQAANFCLLSIQKALKFAQVTHLIETHTDYISYHLNTILKRAPESHAAVDILTVALQLSSSRSLPHLENIFQTIHDEFSKCKHSENINAFLRVFNAFLRHVERWQTTSNADVASVPMQVEDTQDGGDPLQIWLDILEKPNPFVENDENVNLDDESKETKTAPQTTDDVDMQDEERDLKSQLPRHIEMVKQILNQVLKYVGFLDKTHQLLALECLICGIPLLRDYEDELLPIVHLIWSPFVEKFRNSDAVVLNRCFTLLNVLATYAKEFILKRSIDDVIPYLNDFLRNAAKHSRSETITAQTQEFKLQRILLANFANLIESIQIDGRHLNEIAESVSLYLANEQPKELQELAIQFYKILHLYDGPLAYMVVVQKAHISNYKENAEKVLKNLFKTENLAVIK